MTVYIYILTDPRTEEVRYVGLTRYPSKRLCNHCHKASTPHFRNWISSLKRDGTRPTMEVVHAASEETSGLLESQWIQAYQILESRLLNHTTGGEGGYRMSDETRAKISAACRVRVYKPLGEEHKRKLSIAFKGKPKKKWTEESKRAQSLRFQGRIISEETKLKLSESVKASMTPEVRANMSASHKGKPGRPCTEEDRRRISETLKKYYAANPELRGQVHRRKGNVRVVNSTS